MLISLLHLNFYQAFRYNPFLFILLPFLVIYYIYIIFQKYIFKNSNYKKLPNIAWYIILVLAIIFGIMRNIPYFSFLAPTIIN